MRAMPADTLYRWAWHARLPERYNTTCTVACRSRAMNSALVRFCADGWLAVVSRNALRRVRA